MDRKSFEELPSKAEEHSEIKLYRIRWVVLAVFTIFAAASASQWVEYSIIANIVVRYYGVSAVAVDWTSMIAMAMYPLLILPASFLVDKIGLRYCVLLGATGTSIGCWIKIFSVQPHLFWVSFLGQTIVYCFQIFILSLPPRIASIWFGPNELSTACGVGLAGTQLGTAMSFILPPLMVKNHEKLDDIGRDMSYLFYTFAIFSTVATILVFVFFKSQPPSPPSQAQAQIKSNRVEFSSKVFWKDYKGLLTDAHFLLQTVSFGINLGVYVAVCTMLNQFILEYFKNGEQDAGNIGLLLVLFGLIAILMTGPILDKTKKYKEGALVFYGLTILGVGAFIIALETHSKVLVYASGCVFGFFQSSYYTVGMEFGVELSYPRPESSSSGVMLSVSQIFGVCFTLLLGKLYANFGTFWALMSMVAFLVLGSILTLLIPKKLLRQEALKALPESKLLFIKNNIPI